MITKCDRLEGFAKERCFDVVHSLSPAMVQLFAHEMNPSGLCTFLKFCPAVEINREPVVSQEPESEKKTTKCEFCQFLINVIQRYIKKNSSLPAINQTVYQICDKMPQFLQSMCYKEAPEIVKQLAAGIDPHDICVKIGACQATDGEKPLEWKVISCNMCNVVAEQLLPEEAGAVCEELKICVPRKQKPQTNTHTEITEEGAACALCEFLVQTIDKYIKQNKSEAAINQTVYKICNSLPEPLKDGCLQFAPELVKVLSEGIDPKKACEKIKLCTNSTISTMSELHRSRRSVTEKLGPACELCQFLINAIDKYIQKNKTEAAINETVYNFCTKLPVPLKQTCLGFAPSLVKVLSEGLDPNKACAKIGLCADENQQNRTPVEVIPQQKELTNKDNDFKCDLCKTVVQLVDSYIENNKSAAAINATVYKICNSLPAGFKDMCLSMAPGLIKELENGFDPQKACNAIHMCTNSTGFNVAMLKKPVEKVEHVVEEEFSDIKKDNDFKCDLCKTVVQLVDSYIENNKSAAAINATVYKICNSLPAGFKDMCLSMAPGLIKELENGFDPQKACDAIHMCTNSTGFNMAMLKKPVEKIEHVVEEEITHIKKDNDFKCDLCKTVVQLVDSYIENNKSAAAINATVYKICDSLPAGFKDMCLSMAPGLIKELENGLDPQKACDAIHMCTNSTRIPVVMETNPIEEIKHAAAVALKKVKKDNDLKCDMCKIVVQLVDSYIENNKSAAAINATVYKICDSLPAAFKDMCLTMAPGLIKQLENGLDPQKACDAIKMCSKSTGSLSNILKAARAMPMGTLKCELCKAMMSTIDEDLYGDEDKIKKTLDEVCHRLPPPTDQKCVGFMDPNFPKIWEEFLSKMISPTKVCEFLKQCPPPTNRTL
ncbi:uncharacterized protein LOC121379934 [Gigantopelta aegis]|uniref:uncharacterized protein LOC121379934 n=1 Tax=Gigantopelta aegis TaxID=1735272 RepID=UPI001B88922A|nr:uncharacterized protein LOC121379934 [Gigantopelta aegis]